MFKIKTVVIIDDELNNCLLLEEIFEELNDGWKIYFSQDAEEGMDLINTHKPALILVDQMLPGTSGIELAKRIKKQAVDSKLILVSALPDSDNFEGRQFFDGYFNKPIKPSKLEKYVNQIIEE